MLNLEQIPENEAERIEQLGARLKAKIIKDNASGIMQRDAYPKMHGLVQEKFVIEENLPKELAIDLFSETKTYPAWIRFSNQDGTINPDIKGDIRDMAIKLMGVSGEKFLAAEKDTQTHHFIAISTNVFVTKDVAEFDDLIKAATGIILRKILFFAFHWRVGKNLLRAMTKFANPLQIRYFSTTPYMFGDRVVKYAVVPQVETPDSVPDKPSENYLREAMIRQLDKISASFDFCVKFQTNAKKNAY